MLTYTSPARLPTAYPPAQGPAGSLAGPFSTQTGLLLAFGLVLSPSSQLRFGETPVGAGELCFLAWVLIVVVLQRRQPWTRALTRLLAFWTLFGLSLSCGWIAAAVMGERLDPELVMHDAAAYPLLAAISLLCVHGADARDRMRSVAWLVTVLGAVSLFLQLVQALGPFEISTLDPWWWDRLRGWSENPNQLAFVCLVLTFLSLYLIDHSPRTLSKLLAAVCALIYILGGWLTKSDTFVFALIAGIVTFAALRLWALVRTQDQRLTLRSGLAWIVMVCFCALFTAGLALSPLIADVTERMALSLAKNGGTEAAAETDLRVSLWLSAIDRGFESGLLGLGPGPHLEIPSAILEARKTEIDPRNVKHPPDNGTANYEAHNTYLDIFTQGGILALLGLVWLMGSCLAIAIRMRRAGLAALAGGLAIFGANSFILRHPLFWFAIALCLISEAQEQVVQSGRPFTGNTPSQPHRAGS